jgi:hypothetical protein
VTINIMGGINGGINVGINLINAFEAVCAIFTVAAVFTGIQAIVNPTSFTVSSGIPLHQSSQSPKQADTTTTRTTQPPRHDSAASSYIALRVVDIKDDRTCDDLG